MQNRFEVEHRPATMPPYAPGAMRAYSEAVAAREGIE
jgi:hypothetical protein